MENYAMVDGKSRATGTLCRPHFDKRNATQDECDACVDCQDARQRKREHIQQNDTIDPNQTCGRHIALTCNNHPELRWHTKNIDYIGARTIFFSGDGAECDCSIRELHSIGS